MPEKRKLGLFRRKFHRWEGPPPEPNPPFPDSFSFRFIQIDPDQALVRPPAALPTKANTPISDNPNDTASPEEEDDDEEESFGESKELPETRNSPEEDSPNPGSEELASSDSESAFVDEPEVDASELISADFFDSASLLEIEKGLRPLQNFVFRPPYSRVSDNEAWWLVGRFFGAVRFPISSNSINPGLSREFLSHGFLDTAPSVLAGRRVPQRALRQFGARDPESYFSEIAIAEWVERMIGAIKYPITSNRVSDGIVSAIIADCTPDAVIPVLLKDNLIDPLSHYTFKPWFVPDDAFFDDIASGVVPVNDPLENVVDFAMPHRHPCEGKLSFPDIGGFV
jgi:hypothetical protein